jgi:hypothetical protein
MADDSVLVAAQLIRLAVNRSYGRGDVGLDDDQYPGSIAEVVDPYMAKYRDRGSEDVHLPVESLLTTLSDLAADGLKAALELQLGRDPVAADFDYPLHELKRRLLAFQEGER